MLSARIRKQFSLASSFSGYFLREITMLPPLSDASACTFTHCVNTIIHASINQPRGDMGTGKVWRACFGSVRAPLLISSGDKRHRLSAGRDLSPSKMDVVRRERGASTRGNSQGKECER